MSCFVVICWRVCWLRIYCKKSNRYYNMEQIEFDATLGGSEHLPFSANSLKFATSRSIEIAAMTESILRPSKTKLIFQTLPVHMRRRVMSHNAKRLPRKLREGHLQQLKKSGFPPKQKRPSRKYRRRPNNLLEEYTRRKRNNKWLETHIWHAKRFHMIKRWSHCLPYAPCDKAFRACYRATSKHCLIQDISYYTPYLISGTIEDIKKIFSDVTNPATGLSITAKAYSKGDRQGNIHLFSPNCYPFGYIGKFSFIWEPETSNARKVWLFVHPSQKEQVEEVLNSVTNPTQNCEISLELPVKRMKIVEESKEVKVTIKNFDGAFNRFRLTGPNGNAILSRVIKCINNIEQVKNNEWLAKYKLDLMLQEKNLYWEAIKTASSPSHLPPSIIIGLLVRDPRLSRPIKRIKAKNEEFITMSSEHLITIPKYASTSPLWDVDLHETLKCGMLSNHQFIEHITNTQLVPGEVNEEDPALQSVPIVLVQSPGSQDSQCKKLGFGCGWDVIVPPKYGIPFWHTFIMFGARAGGLRETESKHFEMGIPYLPPDCQAGQEEEIRIEKELKDKYFRRPPSKRVNYVKLGINSPFKCHWPILLSEWCKGGVGDFFVLRDKHILDTLQKCIDSKTDDMPSMKNMDFCLVPVFIKMQSKGNLKRHALICLPKEGDLSSKNIQEPPHPDPNENHRKQKKVLHKKVLKQMRRQRIKQKKSGQVKQTEKKSKEPSEYVKAMRELWLPSHVKAVRHTGSRETMGYLHQGAFSFSEAKSCGVGYIAFNALKYLLTKKYNQVLVRNTCSRKYNVARLRIIKYV